MKSTKSITLLYFNAWSIRNKLLDLQVILDTDTYGLVFISETWLKDTDLNSHIVDTHKYGILRNDRKTHAGGVAAIYKSSYADKIIRRSVNATDIIGFEILAFDFYITPHSSICFVCLYLPPQGSKDPVTVSNLIKVLKRFVSSQEVYIVGDFNFSDYKTNSIISTNKEPLKQFLVFLEEHNLYQLITSPTHTHGNILDLIITSHPQHTTNLEILNPFTDSCDHNMIKLKTSIKPVNNTPRTPKLNFYRANYNEINLHLSSINWENILLPNENINMMYSKFVDVIQTIIKLYVPLNKITRKSYIPKEIKRILKAKKILYRKSKSNSSYKCKYKEICKSYKEAIKKYKNNCEQKILKSNSKKVLYNHIKKKLHSRHYIPPLTEQNGNICQNPQSKANLLNNTFAKVFLNDSESTHLPNPITTNSYITPHYINPITHEQILNSIRNMKNSVSQTPDMIPSIFIKQTAINILKPLYIIYNHSLNTGEIPDMWKKATVIPIYKKGKINVATNYRPISLTSVICRIFERIIHSQMLSHLLQNNIISAAQHGFIKQRSTQTQQIDFMDKLTSLYDKNIQLEIVYLDFSKAFDRVAHTKLIHILKYYQINPYLIRWIQNYLSGRTQTTLVEEAYSDSIRVSSGVPQGSVLGPLMFIIYLQDLINTINLHCKNTTVYAFADDLKILSTDPNDLQQALDIVSRWTEDWNLLLNRDKSEHLTIRNKVTTNFYIGNQCIPKVKHVRDLGVTISQDLKWSTHIHKIRSKSNILSHIILRTFSPSNYKLLVNLFKTYIRPIMEYNTSTWSPYLRQDLMEAESVQRSFTRKICQRANIKFSNYNDRLNKLQLESLQSRRIKNDLTLLYKIINHLIDINFTQYFQLHNLGGHNLRRNSLQITRKAPPKTLCRSNFYTHRVIPYWNSLPERTVTAPTLAIFKQRLKDVAF